MQKRPLFLYGTLCHLPLLELVLGRAVSGEPAQLAGYRVAWADGEAFPILVQQDGARAKGLVLQNLTDDEIARLDFYEAGFGYTLFPATPTLSSGQVEARVYLPDISGLQPGSAWSLFDWTAKYGALSCLAAQEIMGCFGIMTTAELARRFPVIRARAQARLFAQSTPKHPLDPVPARRDVTVLDHRRPYSEFFALDEIDLTHRRFDGEMSDPMTRAVFVGCDAVIVLPYDPVRDTVLLVEQFRAGPFARGDQNPWSLEPVAGRIEGGQTPQAAAHREAQEEANLTFTHLETVSGAYPSPSSMSEYYHLFVGLCDLPEDITGIAGLAQEHEDIKSHLLSYDDLMTHVEAGRMTNAPLILLSYWLAYHRTRLRAQMT